MTGGIFGFIINNKMFTSAYSIIYSMKLVYKTTKAFLRIFRRKSKRLKAHDEGHLVQSNDAVSVEDVAPSVPFYMDDIMSTATSQNHHGDNFVTQVPVAHPGAKAQSAPSKYGARSEVPLNVTNTPVTYAVVDKRMKMYPPEYSQPGNTQTLPMPAFFQRNENMQQRPKRYLRGLPKSASLPKHTRSAPNASTVHVALTPNTFQQPDMSIAPKYHSRTFSDNGGVTNIPVGKPLITTPPGAPKWRWEESNATSKHRTQNRRMAVYDTSMSS